MLPVSGSMLTPNLRLLSLLGKGGMGSVWLAEHLALGTEVAVKLLSPELATDAEALSRFRREATAIAQLKSPHVVRIHDVGSAEGTPFFVMERLEGEDLAHRLDRVGRIPLGVVTAVVVQTCKALSRVHELGVVHRDLKPGNVFLTDVEGDLVIKLVDFGIAKQKSADALEATSDGAVLGTPLYMSPEQVLSTKDVTPTSDLYSLGVVVYECLAGEPPFSGETLGALHVAIANGRYAPITAVDPSLPKTLDAWFARALSPVPSGRFASAQEMAETFLAAARGAMPFGSTASHGAGGEPWSVAATASAAGMENGGGAWLRAAPLVVGALAVVALVAGVLLGLRSGHGTTGTAATTAATAPASPASPAVMTASASPAEAASTSTSTSQSTSDATVPEQAGLGEGPTARAAATAPPRTASKPAAAPRPAKDRGF